MQPLTPISSSNQRGLVISCFGSSVAVEAADGQVFQCHLRRNQALPVVGDWVTWEMGADNTGIVTSVEPRRSILAKADALGKQKILAANVDFIVIVMSPPPIFTESLVDSYLMAAEVLHITPIIVLNKIDALGDKAPAVIQSCFDTYKAVYPTIAMSVKAGIGVDTLKAELSNKIAVFVGPSGVGKSSLATALTGQTIRVNDVSPKGAGKHTTTATRLYHLPDGGALIDSPGMRDFTLWPITEAEILSGFKEFEPYLGKCKFRDCRHLSEPNCAVQAAVADGKISEFRIKRYQAFMKQAKKSQYK